jgi:hypothetical protein
MFKGAYTPQDSALFGSFECPEEVDIPLTDIEAYKLWPNLNWMYDKPKLCESLKVKHNFSGIMPEEFPVFQKPIQNLHGRGQNTKLISNPKEFEKSYVPGTFWMPAYTGNHWSVDVIMLNGKVADYFCVLGHPSFDGMFDYWEYKGRVDENIGKYDEHMLQASIKATDFCEKHLQDYGWSGVINFELIGENIIEVHLRMSPQFAVMYGEAVLKQLPDVYAGNKYKKDPMKQTPPGGYVLPMFVEEAPKHGFEVNDKKIKEVLDDENVRHVSFEYTGENNLEDIAHPPGGFYLGSITVTNLDKGREQRKELFKAFVSRDIH